MLSITTTIVLLAFASIISGQNLQYIENGKICTGWQYVTGASTSVDTSLCASAVGYEINTYNNQYVIRFCCTYRGAPQTTAPPQTTTGAPAPVSGECGRQSINPLRTRIVGGQEAIPNSWPWLVSLQYYGSHFCGGTLIDPYHVVTAAHCLQDRSRYSGMTVVAGLHARSNPNSPKVQRKTIANIVNHEQYNENTNENDIAIIRLSSPVTLNQYVNVACLPGKDPSLNDNVMIAGWGTTTFEGNSPDALRQATINIMDYCKYVYNFNANKQFCAGNSQYSKDSCQGDSGGPLMYEVNGQWMLSGVVSYGDECAKQNRPGVYARVSYYVPWVKGQISRLSGK